METWKPIPDFPGYDVSDQGRIRSYYKRTWTKGQRGMSWHRSENPQRIMAGATREYGHRMVILMRNGQREGRHIHRLVLLAFLGPPLPGFQCAHNNGNASDNRLSNLRYDTPWGNAQDKRNRNGKPPEIWVPQLREEYHSGVPIEQLATDYDYSEDHISKIVRGQQYVDCDGPIQHYCSKQLSDRDVYEIRTRIAAGEMQRRLAEEYGVSDAHISRIKSGQTRMEDV